MLAKPKDLHTSGHEIAVANIEVLYAQLKQKLFVKDPMTGIFVQIIYRNYIYD